MVKANTVFSLLSIMNPENSPSKSAKKCCFFCLNKLRTKSLKFVEANSWQSDFLLRITPSIAMRKFSFSTITLSNKPS